MNETRKIEKRKMMGPITILMAMTAVMMIVAAIIMASCTTVDSTVGYTTGQNNETAEKTAEDVSVTTSCKSVWMADTTAVRNYTINVQTAYTARGRMISLTGIYELKVDGNNVVSYLPYFGRAYRTTFGIGSPLDFQSQTMNYRQERTKKNITRIDFDTRNEDDRIHYHIEVTDDGHATIDVTSMYRERIRFDGDMEINL